MSDSIRQQIIDKIDTRFKAIKTTGGYKTNIGNNVFDWLGRDLADTELDALIYRDKTNEVIGTEFGAISNRITLEIEIKTKSGSMTARQTRMMIADVYKAIGTDETWGGLAMFTVPRGEVMEQDFADKKIGSATITVEIEYATATWQY